MKDPPEGIVEGVEYRMEYLDERFRMAFSEVGNGAQASLRGF